MHGNPIASQTPGDLNMYHLEIGRRFPTLQQLDCVKFSAMVQFDVPEALRVTRLPPENESFIVPPHNSMFQVFAHAYDDSCTTSTRQCTCALTDARLSGVCIAS
jgi:hypothetical protein